VKKVSGVKKLVTKSLYSKLPGIESLEGSAGQLLQVLDPLPGVRDRQALVATHLLLQR